MTKPPQNVIDKISALQESIEKFLNSIWKEADFSLDGSEAEYDEITQCYSLEVDSSIWTRKQLSLWQALDKFFNEYGIQLVKGEKEEIIPIVANPPKVSWHNVEDEVDFKEHWHNTHRWPMVILDADQLEMLDITSLQQHLESKRQDFIAAVTADAALEISKEIGDLNITSEISAEILQAAILQAMKLLGLPDKNLTNCQIEQPLAEGRDGSYRA